MNLRSEIRGSWNVPCTNPLQLKWTLPSLCVQCVVAPIIMERREAPILFLDSCTLAYTYPVVSYYKNIIVF